MFLAILYTLLLILLVVQGIPARNGEKLLPGWSGSLVLLIMLAIIGWKLFGNVIDS
jgi:hypothetical protein